MFKLFIMTNVQTNNGITAQGAGDAVINLTKLRDVNDELEVAISLSRFRLDFIAPVLFKH